MIKNHRDKDHQNINSFYNKFSEDICMHIIYYTPRLTDHRYKQNQLGSNE